MAIAILLIVSLVAFLFLAAGKSGDFFMERSTTIAAPAAKVFDLIANLESWERWNPNGMNDSSVERIYGSRASGVGATSEWCSKRSGAGRMKITGASEPEQVVVVVDFQRPFKTRNINTFQLRSEGETTSITWAMRGPKPFPAKLMGLVFNMDRMMARHFDAGLASLKALAEA